MRHKVFGRKLSRTRNERKRLFQNIVRSLFLSGKIVTSKAKAKAVQPIVDKLITRAKKGDQFSYREVLAFIHDGKLAHQIMEDAKGRFSARSSGYTRMVSLGKRKSDATEEVLFSFVDVVVPTEVVVTEKSDGKDEKKKEKGKTEKSEKKTSTKKKTK